jgi:hypothetical protein
MDIEIRYWYLSSRVANATDNNLLALKYSYFDKGHKRCITVNVSDTLNNIVNYKQNSRRESETKTSRYL